MLVVIRGFGTSSASRSRKRDFPHLLVADLMNKYGVCSAASNA
jgi:hypothetical protein